MPKATQPHTTPAAPRRAGSEDCAHGPVGRITARFAANPEDAALSVLSQEVRRCAVNDFESHALGGYSRMHVAASYIAHNQAIADVVRTEMVQRADASVRLAAAVPGAQESDISIKLALLVRQLLEYSGPGDDGRDVSILALAASALADTILLLQGPIETPARAFDQELDPDYWRALAVERELAEAQKRQAEDASS